MRNLAVFLPAIFLLASCAEKEPCEPLAELQVPAGDTIVPAAKIKAADTCIAVATAAFVSIGPSCEEMTARACADTAAGKLSVVTFGYPGDWCAFELWHRIMREEYGIEARHMGCVIYGGEDCYNDVMDAAIEKKFGAGIWNDVRRRVDSICELRNRILVDVPPPIEPPEIDLWTEVPLYYFGSRSSFSREVHHYLRVPEKYLRDSAWDVVDIAYTIDTNGRFASWRLEDYEYSYYDSLPAPIRKRIGKAMRKAGARARWSYSAEQGKQKQPQQQWLRLDLDRKIEE